MFTSAPPENTNLPIPPNQEDKVHLTHAVKYTSKICKQSHTTFNGNTIDKVLQGSSLAYSLHRIESWTSRVLMEIGHEELKEIILRNFIPGVDYMEIVKVKEASDVGPYFIPDFADLAMLPLPLKLVLKNWYESSDRIPEELKKLIESCGPSIPVNRQCCRIDKGCEYWSCYSNACKFQLVKFSNPELRIISLFVECKKVSSSHLDGRKYSCMFTAIGNNTSTRYKYPKSDVTVLMWNCQGVGRPSFFQHLQQLINDHNPDIIALLETRGPKTLLYDAVAPFKAHRIGAAVMTMRKELTFKLINPTSGFDTVLCGFIRGLSCFD